MGFFHRDLLEILTCPLCESKLQLEILSSKYNDGIFFCKNRHWYPITSGLPKILVGKLRGDYSNFIERYKNWFLSKGLLLKEESEERLESRQVQETFYEKWVSKDTIGISDSSPFKDFMRNWILKKYGWNNESRFNEDIRSKRLILDAGAGLGREVINLAKAASRSTVIGIEFSDCAENALRNIATLSNAYIIQGDILRMPFKKECFDFIFSEGVLHHTPNTEDAFTKCCRFLKKGGEIAFYIYRRKGAIREFSDDYIREIMQKVSSEEKWKIAEKITKLGKRLSELKINVEIPGDIPELDIKKGEIDIHRFIYWNFLKCFWNDKLPFDENKIINFDWFVPQHAHRHTEEEIREWCQKNNIEIVWFYKERSGFSVRGIRK